MTGRATSKLSAATLGSVLADELLVTAIRLRSRSRTLDLAGMADDLDLAVDRLNSAGYVESPALLHREPAFPATYG